MKSSNKRRVTVKEIHDIYGIKPSTIYWWLKDRKIPFAKVGKLVFIKAMDVENLLEINEIQPEE